MTTLENDGPNSIDIVAFSRALGNLEATTEALKTGQDDIKESLRDTNRRIEDTNRRIDRLFYAILGIGGALVVAVLVSNYLGK